MTENEELHQEETALWTFPFRPPDRGTTIQELTRQTGGKGPETTQRNSCVNQTGRVAHTHTHTLLRGLIISLKSSLTGYTSSWQSKEETKTD